MKSPQVSLIIVTYNSENYIKKCLESVLNCDYQELEIIIVDNNSLDSTLQILDSFGEKIKVIKSGENLGYAAGNNLAIKKAAGKYIFILNPDTVVEKNFLGPLVEVMEQNNLVGACQPLVYLLNSRNKINLTGKETHFLGFDWIRDYQKIIASSSGEITSFSGSGVLLRKSALAKIGLFDPLYFMYYEDSDLSWRMRLVGFRIFFVPKSVIYHDYKYIPNENYLSLKRKIYFNERNRLINLVKNYQVTTLIILLPAILLIEVAMITYTLLKGWGFKKIEGYFSIVKNLRQISKSRKFIQSKRRFSDYEVTKSFVSEIDFVYFKNSIVGFLLNPMLKIYWGAVRLLMPR